MNREPSECPHRVLSPSAGDAAFACELVRRVVGTERADAARVAPAACERCCEYRVPSPTHVNPVIASLVVRAAAEIERDPLTLWRGREEAVRARAFLTDRLAVLRDDDDGGPAADAPPAAEPTRLHWAVGMLTAPRAEPTVGATLLSLRGAGFDDVHVFAEPGSSVPDEFRHLPRTFHGRRLGNLGNFHTALSTLFMLDPQADVYLVVQDDVEAARGLRAWCDGQLWPQGHGLVSLYTCGAFHADRPGWRVVRDTGPDHTYGALAFAFRRDVLKEFLTDGRLLEYRERGSLDGSDGVVGEWAARRGLGIAYHTPSLVGHTGAVSSLSTEGHGIGGPLTTTRAVRSVEELGTWSPPPRRMGKVGLLGWNTATGLGYMNRDLATHFPIDRWLVTPHPRYPTLDLPPTRCRVEQAPAEVSDPVKKAWLSGLDWVIFTEVPSVPGVVQSARRAGIQVACVPMWEGTDFHLGWLHQVNLMICPTRYTYDLFVDWKRRFGFSWAVEYVPWPVDTRRFRFRRRGRCERFLFVNGMGGGRARGAEGQAAGYRRKGLDLVLQAARLLKSVPFLVYSQAASETPVPANVDFRPPPADNAALYDDGDVCVQPSRWEGLGLQLLECQAAGLPLVTVDAPPMNEFHPLAAVAAPRKELITVVMRHLLTSHNADPSDLAEVLRSLYRTDISAASDRARSFVERTHSWDSALPQLVRALSR